MKSRTRRALPSGHLVAVDFNVEYNLDRHRLLTAIVQVSEAPVATPLVMGSEPIGLSIRPLKVFGLSDYVSSELLWAHRSVQSDLPGFSAGYRRLGCLLRCRLCRRLGPAPARLAAARGVKAGKVSQPRTVEVDERRALSRIKRPTRGSGSATHRGQYDLRHALTHFRGKRGCRAQRSDAVRVGG